MPHIKYLYIIMYQTLDMCVLNRPWTCFHSKIGTLIHYDFPLYIFQAVVFVYDVVTYPVYTAIQMPWLEKQKQKLGPIKVNFQSTVPNFEDHLIKCHSVMLPSKYG